MSVLLRKTLKLPQKPIPRGYISGIFLEFYTTLELDGDDKFRVMALSTTEKEIECVVNWFQNWSPMQKGDFFNDLLDKAAPVQLDSLMSAVKTMNVDDAPPSIFRCQLNLFSQWFSGWNDKQRNELIIKLCEKDSNFVEKFNEALSNACTNS